MVPDELRGRAMAVYTMMFMGMAPMGSLFAWRVRVTVWVLLGPSLSVGLELLSKDRFSYGGFLGLQL